MRRPARLQALSVVLAACGGGGDGSDPIAGASVPPELLACRARADSPFQFAEIALRDGRNLGMQRVADRAGTERAVRVHPDGVRVVFARERTAGDRHSRELFVSSLDGSVPETRLTQNQALDDEPCWSPDGTRILFTSDRAGPRSLWLADAGTGAATPWLPASPAGIEDGEADWHRATNRVVWSQRLPPGRHILWIAGGDGSGAVPVTDPVGPGTGDHAPAFTPDGSRVLFVRRLAPDRTSLCALDLTTHQVTELLPVVGDLSWPRVAPAGDRVWFGLDEPAAGRAGPRLAWLQLPPPTDPAPVLLWPDERWRLQGLDLLPSLPALPLARPPERLDVTRADVQFAYGSSVFGTRAQLASADGDEFLLTTATDGDGGEVAGINCRFDLPVVDAAEALELRARVVARSSRVGGGSVLRVSLYNPVDERFDTAVELAPASTDPQTLAFTTSSLRHVTRAKQVRVTVVADLAAGDRAELRVDLVEVVLVARSAP